MAQVYVGPDSSLRQPTSSRLHEETVVTYLPPPSPRGWLPRCREAAVCSEKAHEACLFQNEPLAQAPGISTPLVLEVHPGRTRARMPKGLPQHWKILTVGLEPDDTPDTDPLRVAPPKPIRNAQRMAVALAPAKQQALIPAARHQLVPDEGGDAARAADRQPRRPLAARDALPPISGHSRSSLNRGTAAGASPSLRPRVRRCRAARTSGRTMPSAPRGRRSCSSPDDRT